MIPKQFYEVLNIGEEVTIELHEEQLVIKPATKVCEDFVEVLLEKLIESVFSGEELVVKFKEVKQMVLNGEQPYL